MPDIAEQIGTVTIAYGTARAEGVDGARELTANSPVFVDDVIVTGEGGSAVEIKFSDGALFSQGPNSSVLLDQYVFDPAQDTGEMTIKMIQGTFRSVTGEIVDMNPEGFQLETPLATIGIRGTSTGHTIGADGQEAHVVIDFVDKPVVIRPVSGGPIRIITQDGMSVTATAGGLSPAVQASQSQLAQFEQLSSQSLQQSAPSFNGKADEDGEGDDSGESETAGEGEGEGEGDGTGEGEGAGEGEPDQESSQEVGPVTLAPPPSGMQLLSSPPPPAQIVPPEPEPEANSAPEVNPEPAPEPDPDPDPDPEPEPEPEVVVVKTLDLPRWGADLTVNLMGGGSAPYDNPYYETTGNSDPELVEQLVDSDTITYDIQTVIGAMPYLSSDGILTPDNVITGNDNDNQIFGGAGGNTLDGGNGNDFLAVGTYYSAINTYVLGALGSNDALLGGGGSDTISFDGNTLSTDLDASSSIEHITLGSSAVNLEISNTLVDAGATLTLDGSASADVTFWAYNDTDSYFKLIGGNGDDYLKGGALSDTLFGGAGDDCLSGQGGNDTISGIGGGRDEVLGGSGNDAIFMNDRLNDSDGLDTIDGGDGNDTLYFTDNGVGTNDLAGVKWVEKVILGDADTNIIYSNYGADAESIISVDGSALTGNHVLSFDGSYANMYLNIIGGAGDDSIVGTSMNSSTLEGGAGADTIVGKGYDNVLSYAGSSEAVTVNLETHSATGGDATGDVITWTNFIGAIGGAGADVLTGNTENNYLKGGAGADTMTGGDGDDTFAFNTGDVASSEEFDGGVGTDRVYVETSTNFSGAVASGNIEELEIAAGQTATFDSDMISFLTGLTTIYGSDTSAVEKIKLIGDANNNVMDISSITDAKLDSMGNEDYFIMNGFGGDDVISAGAGNTRLNGGSGVDILTGGDGDDTFVFNTGDVASGEEFHGGSGDDWVYVKTSTDFSGLVANTDMENVEIASGQTATFDLGLIGFLTGLDSIYGSMETATTETIVLNGDNSNNSIDLQSMVTTFMDWNSEDVFSINGYAGDDEIVITDAITFVDGGSGVDTLATNGSEDLSSLVFEGIEVLDFKNGNSTTTFSAASISGESFKLEGTGSMKLVGTSGDDLIDLTTIDLTSYDIGLKIDGGDGYDTLSYKDPDGNESDFPGDFSELTDIETIELVGAGALFDLPADLFTIDSTMTIDASALTAGAIIDGSSAADATFYFIGSDYDDKFTGDLGDDTLSGGDGADSLLGGSGADAIFGGNGDDTLNGQFGNDTIYGGEGDDFITGTAMNNSDGDDRLFGGAGEDTIKGQAGDDYIEGGDGNDTLYGEGSSGIDGDDTIYGGAGDDVIRGDGGTSSGGDDLLKGGAGADNIDGNAGFNTASYEGSTAGVNIDLEAGTASGGDATGDTLTNIQGLIGSCHADTLVGNVDANKLFGAEGNDCIGGSGGEDTLTGGAGSDTFYIQNTSMASIVITDFDSSSDKIGLGFTEFDNFFPNGFNSDNFALVVAGTYGGTGAAFENGETSGFVYASDGTTGTLWYDSDNSVYDSGDVLLAYISEENGDLTSGSFVEVADDSGGML